MDGSMSDCEALDGMKRAIDRCRVSVRHACVYVRVCTGVCVQVCVCVCVCVCVSERERARERIYTDESKM